jgi:hypothetical protein
MIIPLSDVVDGNKLLIASPMGRGGFDREKSQLLTLPRDFSGRK